MALASLKSFHEPTLVQNHISKQLPSCQEVLVTLRTLLAAVETHPVVHLHTGTELYDSSLR